MSAISYFKICARMNQSLIPPLTGVEIVKATLKARYCVKWQIVYCMYSIAHLGPNWGNQSAWLQCLIVNSAILFTDSWFLYLRQETHEFFHEDILQMYLSWHMLNKIYISAEGKSKHEGYIPWVMEHLRFSAKQIPDGRTKEARVAY